MGRPGRYTKEFRDGAVGQVLDEGRTQRSVADSLGVKHSTFNAWVAQARIDRGFHPDPEAMSSDERAELTRLRSEVRELRMERDILKKAAAFFAKEMIRS